MFADPQSVTITGVTTSLPRVPSGNQTGVGSFASNDGNIQLSVHQKGTNNRCRREFRLTQRKIAADPISSVNKEVSASIIIGIDEPKWGFADAELIALFTAAVTSIQASSNAKLSQLLGGEN